MKSFFRRNIVAICLIIFLAQPGIDILTSLLVRISDTLLKLGMVISTLFLALIVLYCLFISRSNNKKYFITYLVLLAAFSVSYLIITLLTKGYPAMFPEIKSLLKCFYFVLLLCSFALVFHEQEKGIDLKYYAVLAAIYMFTIIIAILSRTDFTSYGHGKQGAPDGFTLPTRQVLSSGYCSLFLSHM